MPAVRKSVLPRFALGGESAPLFDTFSAFSGCLDRHKL
jgi:hypothetical protein